MPAQIARPGAVAWMALALASIFALLMASPSHAATPYRGVNVHSMWPDRTSADMSRELDLAAALNGNVVRVDVGWAPLEFGGKGQYSPEYVAKLDAFMAGARARNLKVVVTVLETPCWASSAPEELKQGCAGAWWERGVSQYPPTDYRNYGDVAKWLTVRYASSLAGFEVWNEPNFGARFWNTPEPARDYAKLLKALTWR